MTKEERKQYRIRAIYRILLQYESIGVEGSNTTFQSYLNYLDRLYTRFVGYGNEEIYTSIRGLYNLGDKANHDMVKRTVFNIINILDKGE